MDDRRYRILMRVAIVLTIAWIVWTFYDSNLKQTTPSSHDLAAAGKQLEDGEYQDALDNFDKVLAMDPANLGALRGHAQTLMQIGAREERRALELERERKPREADQAITRAMERYRQALAGYDEAIARQQPRDMDDLGRRIQGVALANRGILKDRVGDYQGALADYRQSLQLAPEVKEGPGLLTRFMRNQPEKPPTVADRARYLEQQLALPESERLLRLPDEDNRQRSYKLD